jgi:hypothetical protein
MEMRIAIQAESKLRQIRQSPAKPGQRKSKKRAWISFDFLVRIEPFQRVMLTRWAKKFFCLGLAAKNVTRLAIGAQPPLFRMSRPATHDRRASRPAPRGLFMEQYSAESGNTKSKMRARLPAITLTY